MRSDALKTLGWIAAALAATWMLADALMGGEARVDPQAVPLLVIGYGAIVALATYACTVFARKWLPAL